jgi:hypothetical protein
MESINAVINGKCHYWEENNSTQVMDTNFNKYNDDMEEDKEEICISIALADAQVTHTHELFLDASNAWFGGGWTLAPKQKTKEEGCQKTRKSSLKDAVMAKIVAECVDFSMDDYTKALCKEE